MRPIPAILSLILVLAACREDESVAAYAPGLWRLIEIDGTPIGFDASLDLSETGRISGQAPCNSYFAQQSAPYPWFEAPDIAATRRACPELEAEADYLVRLSRMTLAEASGPLLILSNDAGETLTYELAE